MKIPSFGNPSEQDFALSELSPCIDVGDPDLPLDPDGTVADMGALYFDQSPPGIPGDVNDDNILDILDVVIIVNYILGEELTEYQLWAADYNQDGLINILDIVAIIIIIFGPG